MLFRIWLDDIKEMVTCSDYLIDSAGNVSVISECIYYLIDAAGNRFDERSAGNSLSKQRNAYVMRITDYNYTEDSFDDYLYEFDIIKYDGKLGMVYFVNCRFEVWYPGSCQDWLMDIDIIENGELVTNYFKIKDDPKWADFLDRLPPWIKPDEK